MIFFHRTTPEAAYSILGGGFVDQAGDYGWGISVTGVWLSDVPVGSQEGASEGALLLVDLNATEDEVAEYEIVPERREGTYRDWLMPAAFINAKANTRYATEDEEDIGQTERLERGLRILAQLPSGGDGQGSK
jgi:hypothetical protein